MSESTVSPSTPENPASAEPATTHRFEAEVDSVLRLVIESLYSNREIFLRELDSNASDALDKLRFRALTESGLLPEGTTLRVRLEADEAAGTLTISDNGVGMSREELVSHLGTIARSGTRELAKQAEAAGKKGDLTLIGQFGVGFYSAFLVADRVEVVSRAAGREDAWRWESEARGSFTLAPAARETQGTSVVLHLKADAKSEYLKGWQLQQLVQRYSDYLQYPIELREERKPQTDSDGDGEADAPAEITYRALNRGAPLWQRPQSEVTPEQLDELYRHLAHDFEKPLCHKHFKAEGTTEFTGLIFIPSRAPFDLFDPDAEKGLRLYVKRVFVLEDADAVLPRWLRFVRGVVDSEDLPLNVSRELLQDSRIVRTIRKQVIKQTLDALDQLARDRADDFAKFTRTFGAVLKEGLHFEPEHAARLAKLVRYESTAVEGLTSLADAKSRLKEGQKALYYALGTDRRALLASPHLEGLRARGYEVLLMTDSVDHWAVAGLREFEGTPLVSVSAADLSLEGEAAAPEAKAKVEEDTRALREHILAQLAEHVSEVRPSDRLTDSPVCLVVPEGGLSPQLERLIRASRDGAAMPATKRVLELNPTHPVITALSVKIAAGDTGPAVSQAIQLLFAQALIAEGSPVHDPAVFSQSLNAALASFIQ
jgi:molecular chaperone HtpG